jgi:Cohesin domain
MIRQTSLFLACFALGILAGSGVSRSAPVLSAGSATVNVGDMVTIPISITGAAGLTSFQFDLAFTAFIVEVLSFDDTGTDFAATAISQGGNLTGITGFIDNTGGLLSGLADSMSGISGSGLTAAGVLVDITFDALSPGTSPLILSNAFLTDGGVPLSSANGDFMLQNGEIIVRGTAAVPEPGTVLLLVAALGVVWLLLRPACLGGNKSGLQDSVS